MTKESSLSRKLTRQVRIGKKGVKPVLIGGKAPISVQAMTTTPTDDIKATVAQTKQLEAVGCEVIRVSVFSPNQAKALGEIRSQINIPLVADIHFNYKLALAALEQKVDKLRWNPGNIVDEALVKEIVQGCVETKTPMRIGVNAGSLRPDLIDKHTKDGHEDVAGAMIDECLQGLELALKYGADKVGIVLSLKASDPVTVIGVNKKIATLTDWPLHLGVTEAGEARRASPLLMQDLDPCFMKVLATQFVSRFLIP